MRRLQRTPAWRRLLWARLASLLRRVAAWRRASDRRIRIVFHGTPEANVGAICREGLDPARRAGQAMGAGEYFGCQSDVSLGYCRNGKKMARHVA